MPPPWSKPLEVDRLAGTEADVDFAIPLAELPGLRSLPLEATARVALIGAEADVSRVPADLEPVLAEGGRISIGELVTEELLLVLPIVPLHTDGNGCAAAPGETPRDGGSETHRPFARLGELLKR